jgi:hypothetical protein
MWILQNVRKYYTYLGAIAVSIPSGLTSVNRNFGNTIYEMLLILGINSDNFSKLHYPSYILPDSIRIF